MKRLSDYFDITQPSPGRWAYACARCRWATASHVPKLAKDKARTHLLAEHPTADIQIGATP